MWAKIWGVICKHPQTGVSALQSTIGGMTATLPTVVDFSVKEMAWTMFASGIVMLFLAQLKPILDKIYPPDAP